MAETECLCMQGDFKGAYLTQVKLVDRDETGSFIRFQRCSICGRDWLSYEHDEPGFTGSDVWYTMPITASQKADITVDNARALFETASSYWAGGSMFGGRVHQASGKLTIAPWLGID